MAKDLRSILAGNAAGGSGVLGSIVGSYITPAEMLLQKYLPAKGGVLNIADQPKLAAGLGLRGYKADVYDGMYYNFTDSTYTDHRAIDFDGNDLAVIATNYSSSAYVRTVKLSDGSSTGVSYVGSSAPTCVRFSNGYWYVGLNNGLVVRYSATMTGQITLNGGAFSASTYLNIHDVIDVNGYIYVANGEGIFRALSTSTLTSNTSWTKIYNYPFGYVNPVLETTPKSNFVYDSVSGNLLFASADGGGVAITDTGGGNYLTTPFNIGSGRSKIVRWGTSLFAFIRDTPTGATTFAQGSVMQSTNGGTSWFPSTMAIYMTPSKMQPFVRNGYLHYIYRTGTNNYYFRIVKSFRSGLLTPAEDEVNPNILEIAQITKGDGYIGLPSPSSGVGVQFILQNFASAAYSNAGSVYLYENMNYLTQFRLPDYGMTDPPIYILGE